MEGGHFGSDNPDWDWEVLAPQSENHHQVLENPSSDLRSFPNSDEDEVDRETSFTEDDVICSDYFSLDRLHPNSEPELESGGGGVESDSNSGSWMDPTQFSGAGRVGKRRRNYSSSESEASETSDYGGGSGSGSRNQLLVLQPHSDCAHHLGKYDCKELEGFGGGHNHGGFDPLPKAKSHLGDDDNTNTHEIGSEIESPIRGEFDRNEVEELDANACNARNGIVNGKELGANASNGIVNGEDDKEENVNENVAAIEEVEQEKSVKGCSENENEKSVVWWRVPLEVIKYCVLRVSPVWSLSVAAAAIMGFVMYRRRWLSKMKRKSKGLQLNLTVDDKKVSQFMSRAARLNEAFSVVKRVPIIRPALPAPGLASWPVMSLR